MQEDREQLKQETAHAAIIHFELDPMKGYKPVISELELSRAEREQYTHKFSVIIADYSAIVYRLAPGQYAVIEDEEADEESGQAEEDEAYTVLMTAVRYLEINIRQARSVEASEEQPPAGAAYSVRWKLTIDGHTCSIGRYDRQDGPDYRIIEP